MKKLIIFPLLMFVLIGFKEEVKQEIIAVTYHPTKKVDTVTNYFGADINDPYRWLEDDRSEETEAWVKTQNEVTFGYLDQIPFREELKERLTALWNYEKVGNEIKK